MGSHWLETPPQSSKSKMCFVAFNSEQLEMKRKYWTRPLVNGGSCISQLRYAEPCAHTKWKQSDPPVAESKAFRCQPGRKSQQAPQKKCHSYAVFILGHKISSTGRSGVKDSKMMPCILYRFCAVWTGLQVPRSEWAWIIQNREISSLLVYTEIHL